MDDLTLQVMELLQECIVTSADEDSGVEPGKMKTLSAYVDSGLATTFQKNRQLLLTPSIGGSKNARYMAEEISHLVDMETILQTFMNPNTMRLASRL